jgi:hypothetical protein
MAQSSAPRAWLDIDDVFVKPAQDAQTFAITQPLFDEVASASVSYPTLEKSRVPAFGGGVRIFHGLGVGVRVAAVQQQTTDAHITVTVPDPVFFNRPKTADVALPLDRTERAVDLLVAYNVPMPERLGVRVFAGQSRVRITQELVEHVGYVTSDNGASIRIANVTHQTAEAFAWGSLIGVDGAFFVLRNVGVGASFARRNIDLPLQPEPFSGKAFTLSAHRTEVSAGVRLRF